MQASKKKGLFSSLVVRNSYNTEIHTVNIHVTHPQTIDSYALYGNCDSASFPAVLPRKAYLVQVKK